MDTDSSKSANAQKPFSIYLFSPNLLSAANGNVLYQIPKLYLYLLTDTYRNVLSHLQTHIPPS